MPLLYAGDREKLFIPRVTFNSSHRLLVPSGLYKHTQQVPLRKTACGACGPPPRRYPLINSLLNMILVECADFNDTRNKHFIASSMEELFRTVDVCNVLDFINETHIYNKL